MFELLDDGRPVCDDYTSQFIQLSQSLIQTQVEQLVRIGLNILQASADPLNNYLEFEPSEEQQVMQLTTQYLLPYLVYVDMQNEQLFESLEDPDDLYDENSLEYAYV